MDKYAFKNMIEMRNFLKKLISRHNRKWVRDYITKLEKEIEDFRRENIYVV
jgi:hypothetical protein